MRMLPEYRTDPTRQLPLAKAALPAIKAATMERYDMIEAIRRAGAMTLTYTEAWSLWFQGEVISDKYLWGIEILWWGRYGKIAGLISALAVVAEIIGPERLRNFGRALREKTFPSQSFRSPSLLRFLRSPEAFRDEHSGEGPLGEHFWVTLDLSRVIGSALGAIGICLVLWPAVGAWALLAFTFPILFLALPILFSLAGKFIVLLAWALVARPVAWILERRSISDLIKVGSILTLVAGFHFDLLAS